MVRNLIKSENSIEFCDMLWKYIHKVNNVEVGSGVVSQAFNSSTWDAEASLVYRVSSSKARMTQIIPVQKKKKNFSNFQHTTEVQSIVFYFSVRIFIVILHDVCLCFVFFKP